LHYDFAYCFFQVAKKLKQLGYRVIHSVPSANALYVTLPKPKDLALTKAIQAAAKPPTTKTIRMTARQAARQAKFPPPPAPETNTDHLGFEAGTLGLDVRVQGATLHAGDLPDGTPVSGGFSAMSSSSTGSSSGSGNGEAWDDGVNYLPELGSVSSSGGGGGGGLGDFSMGLTGPPITTEAVGAAAAAGGDGGGGGALHAAALAQTVAAVASPYIQEAQLQLSQVAGVLSIKGDGIRYLMVEDMATILPRSNDEHVFGGGGSSSTGSSSSSSSAGSSLQGDSPGVNPASVCSSALDDTSSSQGLEVLPWGLHAVQALDPVLLNLSSTVGQHVMYCTLDSGVSPEVAVELPANVSGCVKGLNSIDGSSCRWDWNSSYGMYHGSHVTGTIAALRNGLGVVGVTAAQGVKLHHVNLFGSGSLVFDADIMGGMESCVKALDTQKVR
jgi:hypothetical protein